MKLVQYSRFKKNDELRIIAKNNNNNGSGSGGNDKGKKNAGLF